MGDHALLTAHDIHGSLMQLHSNLASHRGYYHWWALNRHLRRPVPRFVKWRQIQVGYRRMRQDIATAIKDDGCNVGERAAEMLRRMFVVPLLREVSLARVSIRDLGLELKPNPYAKGDAGVYYEDICAQALRLGLQLCAQDVGPSLRIQYMDQPLRDSVIVASIPISCDGQRLELFGLTNFENTADFPFSKLLLNSRCGEPSAYYRDLDTNFVFELP